MTMEREKSPQEKEIDRKALEDCVVRFLEESEGYNVDCLDMKGKIIDIVLAWFAEKRGQLEEDFKKLHPQAQPAFDDLRFRIENDEIFSVEKIHGEGFGKEFRRTKIVSEWVSRIYYPLLDSIFQPQWH